MLLKKSPLESISQACFFHYDEIASTNEESLIKINKKTLSDNQPYVVVVADNQTAGRGRNHKSWICDKTTANLYYSFAFQHSLAEIPVYMLQIIGSLAVYKNLSQIADASKFRIKYPNDVYALEEKTQKFKKISGILSETNFINTNDCKSVIGIGINVNQTDFVAEITDNATSLALVMPNSERIGIKNLAVQLTETIIGLLMDKHKALQEWLNIINIYDKPIVLLSNPSETYFVKHILNDCRLLLIGSDHNEIIIDNGDSIRYKLN